MSLNLRNRGHAVVACVRSGERGQRVLGADVEVFVDPSGLPDSGVLSRCDAVVNLVGSPLVGRRWNKRRLVDSEESRILFTEKLLEALSRADPRPKVLVSASAVGYYPVASISDPACDESSPPGSGYLSELCQRWEQVALRAESLGIRVVLMRLGVVLGRFGGVLEALEPLFRSGLGASVSSGAQPFSWIHITDVSRAVVRFLEDDSLAGPFNLVAPTGATYRQFVDALAQELGTKARLSIPALALRAALGEGASTVLEGQKVAPSKLESAGFEFAFPTLQNALADLYWPADITASRGVSAEEAFGALQQLAEIPQMRYRKGVLLQSAFEVRAPKEEVFDFYSRPMNLAALIPPRLPFSVIDAPERAQEGTVVTYRTGTSVLSREYRGRIFGITEPEGFFDRTEGKAPLFWFHRHRFGDSGQAPDPVTKAGSASSGKHNSRGTIISDDLWFTFPGVARIDPLDLGGRVATLLSLLLFEYRAQVSKWRFGDTSLP